jgi:hypothetical protein
MSTPAFVDVDTLVFTQNKIHTFRLTGVSVFNPSAPKQESQYKWGKLEV